MSRRAAADGGRHRARAVAYLLAGLLLVQSPVLAPAAADAVAPEDEYTYRAVEVTAENGTLAYDGPPPDDGLRGLACEGAYSRLCGVEVRLLNGTLTVRKVNPVERSRPRYVEFFDRYYERAHERVGDEIRFSLRRVSAAAVLDGIAVDARHAADGEAKRRIAASGTGTVDHELAAPNRPVVVDGDAYVFLEQRVSVADGGGLRNVVPVAVAAGTLLGLWLLRRGWLHYDRWRAD
ncbi:MAG: hypothetical protein ABEJ90_00860 [Halobacterium sp.]